MSYKGIRGYQPLLGIIASNGLIVSSEFRPANGGTPQANLATFIRQCERHLPGRITTIRSDSTAYNAEVINPPVAGMDRERPLRFTITADQDSAVLSIVSKIPQNEWKRGVNTDGIPPCGTDWEVAETVHTMEQTKHSSRLWRDARKTIVRSICFKGIIIGTGLLPPTSPMRNSMPTV